jgi:hypothetical protein
MKSCLMKELQNPSTFGSLTTKEMITSILPTTLCLFLFQRRYNEPWFGFRILRLTIAHAEHHQ